MKKYRIVVLVVLMNAVDMSDPPRHFMLFCKLQKGGLTDAKRSQRDIENPIQTLYVIL